MEQVVFLQIELSQACQLAFMKLISIQTLKWPSEVSIISSIPIWQIK